tara:strand:+ start:1109 stop:4252 length:3144 start_codon:yes stop_codon:yes gene_type:complete
MATEFVDKQWRIPNSWNVDQSNQGKISNYSMEFDGTNDFITISNPTSLPNDFTIAAWIYPTRINDGYEMIYTQGTAVTGILPPYFAVRDSKLHIYITGQYETNLSFIDADEWQHVAVTRTSGVLNLYRNGVEYNGSRPTQNGTVNDGSDGFIGKWSMTPNNFKGKIDQVCVFNYALSQSQVSTLYGDNSAGYFQIGNPFALTTNPVAFYPLGDQAVQQAVDSTNWRIPNQVTSGGGQGYSPWAIDLDGVNDNFKIDNSSEDLNVEYLTASVWFKPRVDELATIIGNRYFNSGYMSWAIETATSGRIRYLQKTPNIGLSFYTTDTYNLDEWNHVAVTYDSVNGAKIYLNGGSPAVNTSQTTPIQYDIGFISSDVTIGSAPGSGSVAPNPGPAQFFDGQLSNVAVWDSGLSSSQIATVYNSGIPGDISSLNPLAWWELGTMTGFNAVTGTWTAISDTKTNYGAVSINGMTEGDLVTGPKYSANATGTSTLVLGKQAPYSFNNALSENMAVSNRDDSQVSDSSPLIIELDLSDETGSYVYSGAEVAVSAIYPYTVDWGDGNIESIASSAQLVSDRLNHTYDADTYPRPVIQIGGSSDTGRITQFEINDGGSDLKLVNVKQFGPNTLSAFNIYGCTNAIITALDNLKITGDLKSAFNGTRANPASINTWDVSTVDDMQYLAANNFYFNQDLNNWDTSSVTNMFRMFFYARQFNGNISNWNINSLNKGHLSLMFNQATSFNQDVDTKYISAANSPSGSEYIAWDTDGFQSFYGTFIAASTFNNSCGNWNTSAVTSMGSMFLTTDFNQDLSTRTVTIAGGTPIAKTYKAWDVKNVTNFQQFLESCTNFNQVLYDWELSANLTNMIRMWRNCPGISASNYAKNWGIFANSVADDNSGTGGAASGFPRAVAAYMNGLSTTPLSVGEPCPISSDGTTQHFTTVGRAMSYLTSDVRITAFSSEPNSVQLYTANFLQSPSSDFPTQLIGVTDASYTFDWSGTQWDFKKSGTILDSNTGATLIKGPSDANGSWATISILNVNAGWDYGKGTDPGDTYMA